MSRMNFMLWSALILIFQSGCNGKGKELIPEVTNPDNHQVVGFNFYKDKPKEYEETIRGLYYYGQVKIEPMITRNIIKGPEAQTFFNHIVDIFGERKENFGLAVVPIIDKQRLPAIVLFNYTYDSKSKRWLSYFNEEPTTKMTLIKANTELAFEFSYMSINKTNFNKIEELSKKVYGAKLILGNASIDLISSIANNIGHILSDNKTSTTKPYFKPAADKKKSQEYILKTNIGEILAKVKFSLILRDSVITGGVIDSTSLNKVPKYVDIHSNPLNFVYTGLQNQNTLHQQLQIDAETANFSLLKKPTEFRSKCKKIKNTLETYDLNLFDRYNAFYQVLTNTDFFNEYNLYKSGCLIKNELDLLRDMGISLTPPTSPHQSRIPISDSDITNLGRYMLNPIANVGFKSDLLRLFSDTVTVQNNELMSFNNIILEDGDTYMSPNELIKKLGEMGIARFGIYNSLRNRHARFFVRPLHSKTLYRIKLKRAKEWGKVNAITIEAFEDDNIKSTAKQRKKLRIAADNKVAGYKTDIMREESQLTFALND